MAGQQQERLSPKQIVLRDLELARASLAHHTALVAEEFSPRAMVARSFERNRVLWIAGAAAAGLIGIKLLLPSRQDIERDIVSAPVKNRGLLSLLSVPLLALGRKAVMTYGTQFIQSYLGRQQPPNDDGPTAI